MSMIEAWFGDLLLLLMQQPLVRWGVALAASLWVWLIGDEDARLRKFYLFAPFLIAAFVQFGDAVIPGSSKISQLLVVQEAAGKMASLIGLGAIVLAAILGLMRGIGFAIGVAVLLCAYFVEGFGAKGGEGGFPAQAFGQLLMLLPTVLVVLLTAYGIGASFRRFKEQRRPYE
ncbi:MAG: hypothetical protein FD175_918 [Beijerinckiaceae bacterium]|nr:MAG: hypothetical protein FD175_918 [Beijerinckiaceae bacterium]